MTFSHPVAVITSDEQALIVASDLAEDFQRDSALRDWRAQWQSLLAQGRLPAGSPPPAAGQALVPMEALLMGRGQLALAQQWGRALDQVSAGMDALTPRASERELLALTKSMKAVTVLFQNDVAAALEGEDDRPALRDSLQALRDELGLSDAQVAGLVARGVV